MIRPKKLNKGDKIAVVSLSRGILGMPFCKHELEIGLQRLKDFGLIPVVMPNALKDINYLENHPEAKATDLKMAFMDDSIKGIICAIGGDDTYRTIPFLMEDKEFINAVKTHPKIFMGFSDTTNNHLMFYKLGLQTFYGQAFLTDLAELDTEMVPYTKKYFEKLFMDSHTYEITSSPVWYFERENFGPEEIGKPRNSQIEKHGFEVLNGKGKVIGELYGGCIESLYDAYTGERHGDDNEIYAKYNLLPTLDEWKEKILFLETSEEQIFPNRLEQILMTLKNNKILENVKGILVGKPMNEKYYEEYKEVYRKVVANLDTPVLDNVSFGHSIPRCIVRYGAKAIIDCDNKKITVNI